MPISLYLDCVSLCKESPWCFIMMQLLSTYPHMLPDRLEEETVPSFPSHESALMDTSGQFVLCWLSKHIVFPALSGRATGRNLCRPQISC